MSEEVNKEQTKAAGQEKKNELSDEQLDGAAAGATRYAGLPDDGRDESADTNLSTADSSSSAEVSDLPIVPNAATLGFPNK